MRKFANLKQFEVIHLGDKIGFANAVIRQICNLINFPNCINVKQKYHFTNESYTRSTVIT